MSNIKRKRSGSSSASGRSKILVYEPIDEPSDTDENDHDDLVDLPEFATAKLHPPLRAQRVGGFHTSPAPDSQDRFNVSLLRKNEYTYQRLQPRQIRLVQIEPADFWNPEFSCSLRVVDLDGTEKYESLSYCWGGSPLSHSILLNGKSFHVNDNLSVAIRQLRRQDRPVQLWIDAICINQDDKTEKSHQIQMMQDIYIKAQRVLVWLGEGNIDSNLAIDFVLKLLSPGFLEDADNKWKTDYGFIALGRLIGHDWFSRAWVVQEVACAREVILRCGDREVHWLDFLDAVGLVQSKLESIQAAFQSSPLLKNHSGALKNFVDSGASVLFSTTGKVFLKTEDGKILGRRLTLEELVSDLTPFQATDPHDNIFAFVGLAKDALPPKVVPDISTGSKVALTPFRVDYNQSILDTCSDFISHCIHTSGSVDIICRPWAPTRLSHWQKDFVDPDLNFEVPSWISFRSALPFGDPKNRSLTRMNGDSLVGSASSRPYNASNSKPAIVRFSTSIRYEECGDKRYDRSLLANGIVLGEITDISNRMADGIVPKECLEMIELVAGEFKNYSKDLYDTLSRILCANRDEKGNQAPSTYRIALLHVLQKIQEKAHTSRSIDTTELLDEGQADHIKEFLHRVQAVSWNRRTFVASQKGQGKKRLLGLGPRGAKVGDTVCILYGASVPFVLRRHPGDGNRCWKVVGDAYVDGQMDGEAFSDKNIDNAQTEFEIW